MSDPYIAARGLGEADGGVIVLLTDLDGDELLPAITRRAGDETVIVVPVSDDVRVATEWDLILDPETLGYPSVAQVWNFGTVLHEQVADALGAIPPAERKALDDLASAARDGAAVPEGLPVGPPVLDDADARLLEQDISAEKVRRYWAPALALAGAETLGQLVAHRRAELEIAPADLRHISDVDDWLGALEADALDVCRALPTSALAALLRSLRLGASRRLARVTRWTIEGLDPALARKGPLGRPPRDVPSTDEYVAALMRDLEGPP